MTEQTEVEKSIENYKLVYDKAMEKGDAKTALQVQKEINKLKQLITKDEEEPKDEENQLNINAVEELEKIASHLLPLELADKDYPLREHARIAAERIREGENFGED